MPLGVMAARRAGMPSSLAARSMLRRLVEKSSGSALSA
ncbi:MAG: hypothetical protein AVDCRST_MAG71-1059 [uncultured Lysobacter sp.]|uniref:Uncharacterized protein n=1 Tax=uncultured Lysobacter sp. TaxID=271060 RepID=A0A6J4KVX1_9GAMM|nr:MAG: hypothetical protein AVDCRST_MAG71-1059 [uncultured Lysobacter sp.]